MSKEKDNKKPSGAAAPDGNVDQVEVLVQEKEKLNQTIAELTKAYEGEKSINESNAKLVDALQSKIAELEAKVCSDTVVEKDTSGVPAVIKYNGNKYTREEVLADKSLMGELRKIGFVKPLKK